MDSRKAFDQAAVCYDEFSGPQMDIGMILLKYLQTLAPSPDALLDIGCGTGNVTEQVYQTLKPKQLIAIDRSKNMITQAKEKASLSACQFTEANFEHIPLPNHCVNCIFSNLVFHWGNLGKGISEANRILKPNGLLALSLPILGHFHEVNQFQQFIKLNLHFQTIEEIRHLLENQGLTVEQQQIFEKKYLFRDIITLLQSLKKTGTQAFLEQHHNSLAFAGIIRKFLAHFPGEQTLTYKVGLIIVRKTN